MTNGGSSCLWSALGGSAGNVIASRLTENPAFTVLVIEAGISYAQIIPYYAGDNDVLSRNQDALATQIPFLAPTNLGSRVTWNYSTTPQTALNDRVLSYDRGKVLGGCSSISEFDGILRLVVVLTCVLDFMTYTRGSNDEFDRWAALTGDQSWAWKNLFPYYFKVRMI